MTELREEMFIELTAGLTIADEATGRQFYYIETSHTFGWLTTRPTFWADDVEMTKTRRTGWWVADRPASRIMLKWEHAGATIGYRLDDESVASLKFPTFVSKEDRETGAHRGIDDDLFGSLYSSVKSDPTLHYCSWYHSEFTNLGTAELAPDDDRTYIARLPHVIEAHREVAHLFPGELRGFRAALEWEAKLIPNVTNVFTNGGFEIYASVPYSPNREYWAADVLRSGMPSKKNGRMRSEVETRRLKINPRDGVTGLNWSDAAEKWDARMDEWLTKLTEWASDKPCGHCRGTGLASEVKS